MNVTVPWRKQELLSEQFCYYATEEGIEEVYFPGGKRVKVFNGVGPFVQLVDGQIMRKPLTVREGTPSVDR